MNEAAEILLMQLLEWLDMAPRCYDEVMDAWRTSCPRFPVWEAAMTRGLVVVESVPGVAIAGCPVTLTARGRALARAGTAVPVHAE